MADSRIPVTVLTGFLGAGKTTLLNHWLGALPAPRLAVLENELSDLPLDTDLLVRVDEDLVETATGCLCCAARGDLPGGLMRLWAHRARFDRVVIETTGLAEPGPVLLTLLADPQLAPRFALDGVVTVVDAVHAPAQLDRQPEARAQARLADRLVVNKTDLVDGEALAALERTLAGLNPDAGVVRAVRGAVPVEDLGGLRLAVADATGEALPGGIPRLPLFASFRPVGDSAPLSAPGPWWTVHALPADPPARLVLPAPSSALDSLREAPFGHHAQDVFDRHRLRLVCLPVADTGAAALARATDEAAVLLAARDGVETRPAGGRLVPGGVVELATSRGGSWAVAVPAGGFYAFFSPRDARRHHGLRLETGDGVEIPAIGSSRAEAAPPVGVRTHADDITAVGFSLPGLVDADLFEGWFGALLATRAADLPRAKGILNIAGSPRRWVFQSVHALADTLPGPPWRLDETRANRLVFIGRGLDEGLLREGFAGCLRPA